MLGFLVDVLFFLEDNFLLIIFLVILYQYLKVKGYLKGEKAHEGDGKRGRFLGWLLLILGVLNFLLYFGRYG
jgi:hypothetical protein